MGRGSAADGQFWFLSLHIDTRAFTYNLRSFSFTKSILKQLAMSEKHRHKEKMLPMRQGHWVPGCSRGRKLLYNLQGPRDGFILGTGAFLSRGGSFWKARERTATRGPGVAKLASLVDPHPSWPSLTAEMEGQVHFSWLFSCHLPTDVVRDPLED